MNIFCEAPLNPLYQQKSEKYKLRNYYDYAPHNTRAQYGGCDYFATKSKKEKK